MARDRKRAKQRRVRHGRGEDSAPSAGKAPVGNPVRADVPGALDHASGDVDEFDAALVRGAGGVPVAPDTGLQAETQPEAETQPDLEEPDVDSDANVLPDAEDRLQTDALSGAGSSAGGDGSAGGGGSGGGGSVPDRPSGAPLRGGNRAIGFLRASWAELQRVQWPDRRQVFQATAVVLGFVAIAGAYLGLADFVAKEIVEFIL